MRANKPTMKILVAKIIPMNPSTCPECAARTVALNDAIPGWAAGKTTSQSPITVVDQWTGFNDATDTTDGVHPNDAGNQKISDRWYPALAAAISGSTPTATPAATTASPTATPSRTASPTASPTTSPTPSRTPSPTASPTTSPTTAPPGPGGCTATYKVIGQWTGGFQGEVTVTNTGTATMAGWVARFTFGNGQQITQSWNAGVTQAGGAVTAKPVTWNANLNPGGSATFGFIASWNGSNSSPAVTCGTS
jgi:cellulase/cellobiase CelA1